MIYLIKPNIGLWISRWTSVNIH